MREVVSKRVWRVGWGGGDLIKDRFTQARKKK